MKSALESFQKVSLWIFYFKIILFVFLSLTVI
jgi:hypothetical protein